MTTQNICPITRRSFCQALALPVGALALGTTIPTWADEQKYETKVLWDFNGCIEDRFMKRVTVYVYKGNAYTWVLLPGLKTMIVKVPLDGSKPEMYPLMPGHVTGNDPHRYYSIAADSEGYIHVSGDMHSSAHVKHWISKKPEDISEFVFTSDLANDKRPQGYDVTYPHFFSSPDGVLYHSIRCAEPVWGIGISVLDVKTQTWSMLGADVPREDISQANRAKKNKDKPMTAWEDNGEGGNFSYTQPHAKICWDKNKRMHVAVALLNANTPSSKGRHTGSDILYAYSDDAGKTFHRGDGTAIALPMRAEPGPHQADVVYSRHDGNPPWVALMPGLNIDEKNRPIVKALDHKTGWHDFVLENGKWTEFAKSAHPSASAAPGADKADEEDVHDPDAIDVAKHNLPYKPHHVAPDYYHETGTLVYATFPDKDRYHGDKPKLHHILIVMSKPVAGKAK